MARPSGAEAQLSFAALIDLCEGLDARRARRRRSARRWRWRCCGASRPAHRREPHAIGLGLRNALAARGAAAGGDRRRPVARRAVGARRSRSPRGGWRTSRSGSCSRAGPASRRALEQALERRDLERVEVGPLGVGATRRLLSERLGLRVPAPLLRRIVDATLGQPAVRARGRPGAGRARAAGSRARTCRSPPRSRTCWARASAALPARDAAAAARGRAERRPARRRAGGDRRRRGGRRRRSTPALLRADGDRVRAAHPLLAAAARGRRPARASGARCTRALADGGPRARSSARCTLALATEQPDAALAAEVAAAAARRRGARRAPRGRRAGRAGAAPDAAGRRASAASGCSTLAALLGATRASASA